MLTHSGLTQPVRNAGFTLLEVVVTLAIFAILTVLTVPSMSLWVSNSKVRSAAESLQNGLRLAQAESVRRSRRVVFSLTNGTAPQTAVDNGISWSIYTIPSMGGEGATFIEAGDVTSLSTGITNTGPGVICFNSVGRLIAYSATGVGKTCTLPTTAPPTVTYALNKTGADRPLSVIVALGGQVHLCDPNKTLSTDPDGCPP